MSEELRPVESQVPDRVREWFQTVETYLEAAHADSTRLAYRRDWEDFVWWLQTGVGPPERAERAAISEAMKLRALSVGAEAVAAFIAYLAEERDLKPSSIQRKLAALSHVFRQLRDEGGEPVPDPTKHEGVRRAMQGIRRMKGVAPDRVRSLTREYLRRMVAALPDNLKGARDRALLLVGFYGAFRRSELAALQVEDLEEHEKGLTITVPRSKTDQEGEGLVKILPAARDAELCPVRALRAWLHRAEITSGAVFRSLTRWDRIRGEKAIPPLTVAHVVKEAALAAGVDPEHFSGHSLRAGFVTSAVRAGVSTPKIQHQTGHKTPAMIAVYTRMESAWEDNAALDLAELEE